MKTLSLNKLLILIGLFLVSALFTTGANASCVAPNGVITTVSGNSNTPVFDTRAPTTAVDACTQTPDEYKVTLFKLGLCTADTSFNDLSSCQYIINSTAGVEEVIKFPATNTMNIPEFAIEPGSYGYMVVVLGSKLGIKHNFQTSNAIDGATGTGKHCWTSNTGYTGFTSEDGVSVTGWGNSTVGGTQMLECGASAGTAVFTHEVINKLNGDTCSATWVANGDRWPVVDENGDPIVENGSEVSSSRASPMNSPGK